MEWAGERDTPIYRGTGEREDTVYKEGTTHHVAEQHGVVGGAAAPHTPPLITPVTGRWVVHIKSTTPPPTAPQAQRRRHNARW